MESNKNNEILVALMGDIACNNMEGKSANEYLININNIIDSYDFAIANLEASYNGNGKFKPIGCNEKIHVYTNFTIIEYLKKLKVKIVSVANNHSFDFGLKGWGKLTSDLKNNEILFGGGGINLTNSKKTVITTIKGLKIAVICLADNDCGAIFATKNDAGVNPLIMDEITFQIKNLKSFCDIVICSIHWGEERIWLPSVLQRRKAKMLAEAGANVIIGHHPHVLQGYEKIKGCHVFYSLGNFIMNDVFDQGVYKVKFRGPSLITTIPVLKIKKKKGEIECTFYKNHGVIIKKKGIKANYFFKRRWHKLCYFLRSSNYEKIYNRHLTYMWRYYIPIRHTFLPNPIETLKNINLYKIMRLFGVGKSPYKS